MVEINNKTRSKINLKKVKQTTEKFLKYYRKEKYNVSIAFVGDITIKKLNEQYRRINKITDVLTFHGENHFLGEVIIDYARIKRQAVKFQTTNTKELIFILVHGLLHLIGYNDDTDKEAEEMDKLGHQFIKTL